MSVSLCLLPIQHTPVLVRIMARHLNIGIFGAGVVSGGAVCTISVCDVYEDVCSHRVVCRLCVVCVGAVSSPARHVNGSYAAPPQEWWRSCESDARTLLPWVSPLLSPRCDARCAERGHTQQRRWRG
jgi:hypothetical protein